MLNIYYSVCLFILVCAKQVCIVGTTINFLLLSFYWICNTKLSLLTEICIQPLKKCGFALFTVPSWFYSPVSHMFPKKKKKNGLLWPQMFNYLDSWRSRATVCVSYPMMCNNIPYKNLIICLLLSSFFRQLFTLFHCHRISSKLT